MSLDQKFHKAVKIIRSLPLNGPYQTSNRTKLKFYSLFKQATEGRCNQPKPSFWDIVGRAKWEAWNNLGEMSTEMAMINYIDELNKITSTLPYDVDIRDFLPPPEVSTGRSTNYMNKVPQQAVQLNI